VSPKKDSKFTKYEAVIVSDNASGCQQNSSTFAKNYQKAKKSNKNLSLG